MLSPRSLAVAASLTLALGLGGCAAGPVGWMNGLTGDRDLSNGDASFNRVDLMFTAMMIPHHEGAIEMSDVALAKSDIDPQVRALAQRIKDAQQPEIDLMKSWLTAWGETGDVPMGHDHSMMTMEGDLAALEKATGAEADRLFLQQMIAHHEGALDMAWPVVRDGKDPAVIKLAQSIIDSQTAEIEEMKDLLASR